MRIPAIRTFLLALAFALGGCGGGGGGAVASIPPPPPAPPPVPPPPTSPVSLVLVPGATTSQQFTVAGASHLTSSDAPQLGTADQLQIRYDASSRTYEVQLPNSQTWSALSGTSEIEAKGGGVTVVRQQNYQYSSLIEWFTTTFPRGVEAIGVATPAGSVPVVGNATYAATIFGRSSESASSRLIDPLVAGSMTLNFDFAHGSLDGRANFVLDPDWNGYDLGTFAFRDTVYSTGSTSFSGRFDTILDGVNSFSGLFTGPNAEELIGNFAFPYRSPIDSKTYQTHGAFIGRKN